MSEENWVEDSVLNARQHALPVPNAVWTLMETLLKGRLSRQSLPAIELQSIAMQLISEAPVPKSEQQ